MPDIGGESMLSVALGVAIGATFVFMLFSLFLSTVLEAIASLLKLRGRALRVAMARLVGDPAHLPRRGGFGLLDQLLPAAAPAAPALLVAEPVDADAAELHEAPTESHDGDCVAPTPLSFAAVFCHPLVGGADVKSMPSYVSARNFSTAMLQALRSESRGAAFEDLQRRVAALPPGQLRQALQTALDESNGSVSRFKEGIDRWYEHAMDRLGGWYRRFSQLATFLLGLALAAFFNIDAVGIAKRLYVDPVMRQIIERQALDYVNGHAQAPAGAPAPDAGAASSAAVTLTAASAADATTAQVADFEDKVQRAQAARDLLLRTVPFVAAQDARPTTPHGWVDAVIGWVITALAGMLGAPFWFQLLQRVVNLRGAGAKPTAIAAQAGEAP